MANSIIWSAVEPLRTVVSGELCINDTFTVEQWTGATTSLIQIIYIHVRNCY